MTDQPPWVMAKFLFDTLAWKCPFLIWDDGPGAVKKLREAERVDTDNDYIFVGDDLEFGIVFTQYARQEIWFNSPRVGLEGIFKAKSGSEYDLAVERCLQVLGKLGYA